LDALYIGCHSGLKTLPASVKRLMQKQAPEKPSSEVPEWAKEYLRKQDAK
jgi:hypothetical protein